MKTKLFSGQSLLVSLKGIGSSIVTYLTALPFVALMYWLVMVKQMFVLGGLFGLFVFVWYLFFWGYFSSRIWKWR